MAFLRPFFFLFAAGSLASATSWDFFLSLSQGYTHYEAGELNRVLVLLEQTTQQQAGFNNYQVNRLDGHPYNGLVAGLRLGAWRFGVEAEFWVEEFAQHEVPFDLRNASRADRITCAEIRASTDLGQGLYGCVEAHESISFLPLSAQISRSFPMGRQWTASLGYGLGVLAGSAHLELSTEYFGQGAVDDDRIRFKIWPGVNLVHKVFGDVEWKPWRHFGFQGRGGWRLTRISETTLKDQEGSSLVFSTVFPAAREDSRLYIQSGSRPGEDQIYLGTPEDARNLALSTGTRVKAVEGDFTGWFAGLKLNCYWRGI